MIHRSQTATYRCPVEIIFVIFGKACRHVLLSESSVIKENQIRHMLYAALIFVVNVVNVYSKDLVS